MEIFPSYIYGTHDFIPRELHRHTIYLFSILKKLIIQILVCSTIIFVCDRVGAYYLEKKYLANEKDYANGHLNYYLNHVECDTLFIGSSRTVNHVDPRLFGPNSYNLGKHGMHIGYQSAQLSILEQEKKLPKKLIVLDLGERELSERYNNLLREQVHYLRYYYDKNEFIRTEINKHSVFEFVKYFSKLYLYNGNASALITKPVQNLGKRVKTEGFEALIGTSKKLQEQVDEELKKRVEGDNFKFYLNHIQKLCKRNNIELVCVISPYYGHPKYVTRWYNRIQKLVEREGIKVLNYHEKFDRWQEDRSLWRDGAHFNETGAKEFTLLLKEDLNKRAKD